VHDPAERAEQAEAHAEGADRGRCGGSGRASPAGSLPTRIEMKMMLSRPSTISRTESVSRLIQTSGTDTTDTTATTGDPLYCQGWDGPDGPPFLDLYDKNGDLLADGGVLPLECGAQGIFMFGLYPKFGGFTPASENIDVDLVVDVEGFNNNPEGHFYSAHPVGYYISCDDVIGGVVGVLPIFTLDNLDNLEDLDGKPAQIHVVMPTGDEPIAVDLDVTLSVVKDDSWTFCGG
jgi:hypothetical protein